MARNVEIKARLLNRVETEAQVRKMATDGPLMLRQEDTFYVVPAGRLKLRTEGSSNGKLIHYQRPDRIGPKLSEYTIVHVQDAAVLKDVLGAALGLLGSVAKVRTLYQIGRTRVHFDEVESLGDYLELEVVLMEGEDVQSGLQVAETLLHTLGIQASHLESRAYVDLLATER